MANARFLLDNFSDKATIYSYPLNEIVDISNVDNGLTLGTGYVNTTGFSFYNIVRGSPNRAERCQITVIGDIADSLDGQYFTTYTPTTNYYIWFSTNDSTVNPQLADHLGIKVNINTNDTANDVALKLRLRLFEISSFITQDGFETDNPLINIQDSFRDSFSRTVSNTDIEIAGEFDTVRRVSCFVLGRHKLELNTKYRLRLYSDPTGEDRYLKYDTGYLNVNTDLNILEEEFDPDINIVEWFDEPVETVRYFKLNFYINSDETVYFTNSNFETSLCNLSTVLTNNHAEATGTPDSLAEYFEFGRLFIGDFVEVRFNISYGHSLAWEENTTQHRPNSGTLRSDKLAPYRSFTFSLKTVPEEDRPKLQHGFRTVGLRRDFYISLFSDDLSEDKTIDYAGILKLTKIPKFTEFNNNYYNSKFTMEEV